MVCITVFVAQAENRPRGFAHGARLPPAGTTPSSQSKIRVFSDPTLGKS